MSTEDCFIVFGPLIAFSIGAALAFGIHHYNSFKRGEF